MDNSGMELQVKSAQEGVRSVPLATDRITLGRAADNDLAYPEDSLLSRHHLVLEREGPVWWVQDLRSKNGTQVNGEWLTTRRVLQPGDTVSAGQITLIYRPPGPKSPTTVQFVDETPQTASTYSTSLFQATAFLAVEERPDNHALLGLEIGVLQQPVSIKVLGFLQIGPDLICGLSDDLGSVCGDMVPGPVCGLVDAFGLLDYGLGYLVGRSELRAS